MPGKTRDGNRWLKRVLCQVGWAASPTRNAYFAALFRRLAARRGNERVILVKDHQSYQDLDSGYLDK